MGFLVSGKIDVSDKYTLLDELAEEFVARYRRGEHPALTEYVEQHPELADDIRELFPALVQVEQADEDLHAAASSLETGLQAAPALTHIGDYRILREIGRGGMGVVYEAEQRSLGRRVALKLLPLAGLKDTKTLVRFQREARAAARLHHTNIVPVFDVGQDKEYCYYAMQLIQGQTLSEIIGELRLLRGQSRIAEGMRSPYTPPGTTVSRAPAPHAAHSLLTGRFSGDHLAGESPPPAPAPDRTEIQALTPSSGDESAISPAAASSAKIAGRAQLSSIDSAYHHYVRSVANTGQQVADALAFAHARGIIHRDIKPANLMLDAAGVIWVTDFGLCKTTDEDLTETGDLLGTFRYMAPERFRDRGDSRVDTYALGLTLYELLVLKSAFPISDRLGLLDAIQTTEPPRPRAIDPRIPRDLETIVLTAINKDPDHRYQSAEAMGDDLRRFLADEPVTARRVGSIERLWRWCRRNPAVASLAASVFLLLTALALVSSIGTFRLSSALKDSKENLAKANEANATANVNLWESLLSQARASRMTRQIGQRFETLRAIKKALKLPLPPGRSLDELRNEAIAALMLPDVEVRKEWDGCPLGTRFWVIDADFRRYARANLDASVSVRRVEDDVELLRLPGSEGPVEDCRCRISPDGKFLFQNFVAGRKSRVGRLWRVDGAAPVKLVEGQYQHIAFRPDCRQAAISDAEGSVRVFELPSGTEQARWRSGMTLIHLTWNPKFAWLALQQENLLKIVEAENGHVLLEKKCSINRDTPLVWHPDGAKIAFADGDGSRIMLIDASTGERVLPPLGDMGGGIFLNFNHAGDRLVNSDWKGTVRLWDLRTGKQLLTTFDGRNIQFSTDDRSLVAASYDGKSSISHVQTGEEFVTVLPSKGGPEPQSFNTRLTAMHKNGRLIATGLASKIALVDIFRGEEIARLPLNGNPVRFDADGAGLWFHDWEGLFHWPIRYHSAQATSMHLDSPLRIGTISNLNTLPAVSEDGGLVAIPNFERGTLLWEPDTNRMRTLGPQSDVRNCAMSPDRRWVATGSHELRSGAGARVWNAATGRLAADLPASASCTVGFSPDGRWLVTAGGGPRLWIVGKWTEGPPLGSPPGNRGFAFAADSKMLALGDAAPGVVRLVGPDSGREIARLSAPEASRLWPCCFTPDGGRLVTVGIQSGALHIFNLRAIRTQLAELGLDWDAPPLPPASAESREPIQVEIDLGDFLQKAKAEKLLSQANRLWAVDKKHAEAIGALREAIRADPKSATAHNNLAWFLSVGPMDLRDPKEALTLARQAVELNSSPVSLNTLGVVLYRSGEYPAAVTALEQSLAASHGQFDAYDLFFLAMCRHRLGDDVKSKESLERAVRWIAEKHGKLSQEVVEELTEIQTEAEKLLAGSKERRGS